MHKGVLAAYVHFIQNCSVEKYLCSVGKLFATVVTPDPHLNSIVILEFSLGRQLMDYTRQYPPPLDYFPSQPK